MDNESKNVAVVGGRRSKTKMALLHAGVAAAASMPASPIAQEGPVHMRSRNPFKRLRRSSGMPKNKPHQGHQECERRRLRSMGAHPMTFHVDQTVMVRRPGQPTAGGIIVNKWKGGGTYVVDIGPGYEEHLVAALKSEISLP